MEKHIDPAGDMMFDLKLIYHPLGNYLYAYNYDGARGIANAEAIKEAEGNKIKIIGWEIVFSGERFLFDGKPIKNLISKQVLTQDDIEYWLKKKEIISPDELYREIKQGIATCFDFVREIDYDVATMFTLQTWFSDLLEGVFYLEIKSKYGSGKTVLLEILEMLCKNGVLINDISFPAIPRCIEKYKLTCLIDELDNINKKERYEIFKILRAGYRKGSGYIRLRPKTFDVESFRVYGAKAFNYRSDIPDDLKSRALPVNLAKSDDKFLPILNFYKKQILKRVYRDAWIFYINYFEWLTKLTNDIVVIDINKNIVLGKEMEKEGLKDSNSPLYDSNSLKLINFVNQIENSPNPVDRAYFKQILENYRLCELEKNPEKQLCELLANISGRNIELFFLIVQICDLLNLEIADWFVRVFEEKEVVESVDIEAYQEALRDVLADMFEKADDKEGMKVIKHKRIASEFNIKIKSETGKAPSSHELKKQLREIGFIDGINRKVIKMGDKAHLCLIYDNKIRKILNLPIEIQESIGNKGAKTQENG